jgi:hypothetical protein
MYMNVSQSASSRATDGRLTYLLGIGETTRQPSDGSCTSYRRLRWSQTYGAPRGKYSSMSARTCLDHRPTLYPRQPGGVIPQYTMQSSNKSLYVQLLKTASDTIILQRWQLRAYPSVNSQRVRTYMYIPTDEMQSDFAHWHAWYNI